MINKIFILIRRINMITKYMGIFTMVFLNKISKTRGFFTRLENYKYQSDNRRRVKRMFKLQWHINDHHIIPKQLKSHKTIKKFRYPMNSDFNLVILPRTEFDKDLLNTVRLNHNVDHRYYTKDIKKILENMTEPQELEDFVKELRLGFIGRKELIVRWKNK